MSQTHFSDIKIKAWFDRFLPKNFYHYARLARWDRPVGVWLLFLPCLWGVFLVSQPTGLSPQVFCRMVLLFFIGSVVMRGAGCTINDLWDKDLDQKIERTRNRPLASGRLSRRQALFFLGLQLLIGAVILFQFNLTTILIGLFSLPLIVLYPLMKRWTWWPQVFLGLTFNWGILMGASSVTGTLSGSILWLYAAAILWTIAYDTIYAFQDIEDDMRVGIKSTARFFKSKTKLILTGFYMAMALCFVLVEVQSIIMRFGAIVIIFMHLISLWRFWDMADQQSSLNAFKRHISFGWVILAVIFVRFLLTV